MNAHCSIGARVLLLVLSFTFTGICLANDENSSREEVRKVLNEIQEDIDLKRKEISSNKEKEAELKERLDEINDFENRMNNEIADILEASAEIARDIPEAAIGGNKGKTGFETFEEGKEILESYYGELLDIILDQGEGREVAYRIDKLKKQNKELEEQIANAVIIAAAISLMAGETAQRIKTRSPSISKRASDALQKDRH